MSLVRSFCNAFWFGNTVLLLCRIQRGSPSFVAVPVKALERKRYKGSPQSVCFCSKSLHQLEDMKKRFNINLDDSAFTKERTPVGILQI